MKTLGHSTNSSASSQLALFDANDYNDNRPAPERVASAHGFALAYHEDTDGDPEHRWYAVQDWIAGVAHASEPRKFLTALKSRLKKAGFELSTSCRQLPYLASNSKKYKTDHAQAETLYLITQRMDANTPLRDAILRYLAKAGVRLDQYRRDPEKMVNDAITAFKRQGKDDEWIETRFKAIDTFKALTSTIQRLCDSPRYGDLINTEYMELFGSTAAELQRILNTKSVRNSLPALQLSYVETAERAIKTIIQHKDRMSNPQLIAAFVSAVRPLGVSLEDVCRQVGIDRVTGLPLIEASR